MARPKEFDVDATLERAMQLFWERGYTATSMGDLATHLGVARQSLYDTFGDKHALYTRALERNRAEQFLPLLARIAEDEPLLDLLRGMLRSTIDQDLASDPARGCMFVNAAIELASTDVAVRALVAGNMETMQRALALRFRRARKAGELPATADAEALAHYFLTVVSGLRVVQKTMRNRKVLEKIAVAALGAFSK